MRFSTPSSLVWIGIGASAGLIGWLLLTVRPASTVARPATFEQPVQVSTEELRLSLHRLSLEAKALAAAGVTNTSEIAEAVASVENELAENPDVVMTADAAVGAAEQVVTDLEEHIQAGLGTSEDVTALASARNALTAATTSRDQLLDTLFTVGSNAFAEEQRARMANIRANRTDWTVPIEFLTVNRTELDWVFLRDALAHERIAIERGEPVDDDVQTLLTEARGETAVAAAIANLSANLATIEQAWQSATAN
jgi:hypothetical protein